MMVSKESQNPLEGPQADERTLDAALRALATAPLCCRCGSQIQGMPVGHVAQCPQCKTGMRHVGRMWMEYVSPLEVPPSATQKVRNFRRQR